MGLFRWKLSDIPKGEFKSGSVADQIMQTMRADPTRNFSAEDLIDEEAGRSTQNVRNALFRLHKNEQLLKAGRGLYRVKKEA